MKRLLLPLLAALALPTAANAETWVFYSRDSDREIYIRILQGEGRFREYEFRSVYSEDYEKDWQRRYARAVKLGTQSLWKPYSPIRTSRHEVDCQYPVGNGSFRVRYLSGDWVSYDDNPHKWLDIPQIGTGFVCNQ